MAKSEGSFIGSIFRSILRTVFGILFIVALIMGANIYVASQGGMQVGEADGGRFETLYGNPESQN